MKKKFVFLSFCFILALTLCACSKGTKPSNQGVKEDAVDQSETENKNEPTKGNEVGNKNEPTKGTEVGKEPDEDDTTEDEETKEKAVKAQIKVYEGCYFDESVYQYTDPEKDPSSFVYCEIIVSNVTDTSFEFEVNEITYVTGEKEVIFPKTTAVFIEDGTKAAYYGEDQTFYFEFPGKEDEFPKIIKVSGFEKLEGNTYMNNSIPGHESG